MTQPDLRCRLPATGALEFSASGRAWRRPLGRHSLKTISRPMWAALAATGASLVLLVGFQQVVSQSVVQAEQRKAATLALDDSIWRCKLLLSSADRMRCLTPLSARPGANPSRGAAPAAAPNTARALAHLTFNPLEK
jgi:hypothetical protein